MAIISVKKKSDRRYRRSQIQYAIIYVVITFAVLAFLNIYCSAASQKLFYQGKESSMIEKAQLAATEVASLEVLNPTNASAIAAQMSSLKVTRLIITDQSGIIVYDSNPVSTVGHYALLPQIVKAMESNDVFTWRYHDGVMCSEAATPVVSYDVVVGCVYMMEYDTEQGSLIRSQQNNILRITIVLELVVLLFSLIFSYTYSSRLRRIMASMRIIQEGDYTHKLTIGGRDELTFLGEEVNDLTDRLQISESKRRQFVSDAAHELKTPLASIKLLSDSILQNEMDTETVREFVGDIGNEAERLNRLSQKLLALTKGEAEVDEEVGEIVEIAPTIRRVVKMLRSQAEEKDIALDMDIAQDSPVLISEEDLYQIVFNLVENGIKYNRQGGLLHIALERSEEYGILKVSDSGVGIPEDSIEHIFERFYRVDKARSRASGGSGLGLSIVRNLVERNQGRITVESKLNEGSTFIVEFPTFYTEEENG